MITDKGVLLCRAIVLCCTNRKPALLPPDLFVEYIIINSLLVKGCAVMYKQKTRTSTARPFLSRTQSLIPFWCRSVLLCTNRKPALLPSDSSVKYNITDFPLMESCAVMYKQKTRTSTTRPSCQVHHHLFPSDEGLCCNVQTKNQDLYHQTFLSSTTSLIPVWWRVVLWCTNRKPGPLPPDFSVKYIITDFLLMEGHAVIQKTRISITRSSCQAHHHWFPSDGGLCCD